MAQVGPDELAIQRYPSVSTPAFTKSRIKEAASRIGFDLCGIAPAVLPDRDKHQYLWWLDQGFHGEMTYMEREQRRDLRLLLPDVRSIICVAMVYNAPHPKSTDCPDPAHGWISRYAWGDDYHDILRQRLELLLAELRAAVGAPFDAKICIDTAPLLERAVARAAGLGWIGKNTCLIDQKIGSWFLVGEILTSLEIDPDEPVADRCGTCTRCIDACPTAAITQPGVLDATRCISYLTIETRGSIPEEFRPGIGRHVFGCDICQDVCPWNNKAPVTLLPEFQPRVFENQSRPFDSTQGRERKSNGDSNGANTEFGTNAAPLYITEKPRTNSSDQPPSPPYGQKSKPLPATAFNPPLEWLASLTQEEFSLYFRRSPIKRARYRGMLRNAAVAMGNSQDKKFEPILRKLADHPDEIVQEHARWALGQLK